MKRYLLLLLSALLTTGINISASNLPEGYESSSEEGGGRRIIQGYDGGMMLHTGYISGTIPQISHDVSGMPKGIGGAIKFHIGEHFRFGTEGYVSTLGSLGKGSMIKYGWGGLLADCRLTISRVMPYAGLTIGGGSRSVSLVLDGDTEDWMPESKVIINKHPFFAVAPFIGCDFIVSERFHLTLKCDWMNAFSGGHLLMPTGPRIYFGFLMYH